MKPGLDIRVQVRREIKPLIMVEDIAADSSELLRDGFKFTWLAFQSEFQCDVTVKALQ
jgi:hypothetical protein